MPSVVRRTFVTAMVGVLLAAGDAPPARGAPVPARVKLAVALPFPASSELVVQVNGIERVPDRVVALAKAAVPDVAPKVAQAVADGVKDVLAGRSLDAVPKSGRWYLVVANLSKLGADEQAVAVLVPVSDPKAFRESFLTDDERKTLDKVDGGLWSFKSHAQGDERTVYLVDLPGYVALSPSRTTAEGYTGKYTAASADRLGEGVAEALTDADVSVYVNMDAVNAAYGNQLVTFRQFIDLAVNQAQAGGLNKKQTASIADALGGFFQGVEDARGIVLAADCRPGGLNARVHVRFAGDSKTGKLLRDESPTALAEFGKLPRGQASYSATRFGRTLGELTRKLSEPTDVPIEDEAAAAALKAYTDLAADPGDGSYQAASMPDSGLNVAFPKEPAKLVAAQTTLLKALPTGATFANVVLKDKPKVSETAHKVGAFVLHEVAMAFDFEATVKDYPPALREPAIASLKRVAKEKSTFFYGTDGKAVVQVMAADWPTAEALLKAYTAGTDTVGDDAAFKLTRDNLPAETTALLAVDAGRAVVTLAGYVKTLADAVPGFPGRVPDLKPTAGTTAFVGLAFTVRPENIRVDVFVPAGAVVAGRKVLEPAFKTAD